MKQFGQVDGPRPELEKFSLFGFTFGNFFSFFEPIRAHLASRLEKNAYRNPPPPPPQKMSYKISIMVSKNAEFDADFESMKKDEKILAKKF